MKRRIATLMGATLFAMASFVPSAMGAIDEGPGRGNPDLNPTGKCPPGQNADTSVGGLKKCD
jgi:hypothetical protein